MRNKFNILEIYNSSQTVFTFKDLALLWQSNSLPDVKARVNYYVRKGDLFAPRKGFYCRDKNYNKLELANKLYKPSYISLDTILFKNGIIFQYSEVITAVSYLKREIISEDYKLQYYKIKDSVLCDPLGIEVRDNVYTASTERALLDALYLNQQRYFDNLRPINWDKCLELMTIYNNKTLLNNVLKLKEENNAG